MKYAVVLGDGMADYPVKELGNKTPLQKAATPCLDSLCAKGVLGMVRTIPAGLPPGSDTANLSILGYDPRKYYSGRSPFEAASIGVKLKEGDIAFRCNLVTLSEAEPYGEKTMVDHSAGEITTVEAGQLIKCVDEVFGEGKIAFYRGTSYRHLMVWQGGPFPLQLTPPHDILGKKISPYLPQGEGRTLIEIMEKSVE
ncbi:MAG TPA: phosphoglycerate mutase, partial [Firmicutes bacterium]|nr:phosphoglycerate mutase [Bacillota bacterium]